jgi:hypothetical protein
MQSLQMVSIQTLQSKKSEIKGVETLTVDIGSSEARECQAEV